MSSSLDCRSCMSHLIFIQRKITKINFRNNPRVSFNNAIKFYINIQSAKTRPGADCGSDHELLIAKFRLKLKKVGKTTRPFRYDVNQILYDYTVEVRNRFKGLDLVECLMNYGQRFMTLYRKQWPRPSPEKEMQKGKMAVWGGLTNSCEKKRREKQRRKGKI